MFLPSREPQCEVVDQRQLDAHVIAGLDEKRVFSIWDPVLGLSQKKIYKEEEGRSEGSAGCGQRLSAVQVRHTPFESTAVNFVLV